MTTLLADHNVERHLKVLFTELQALEWADLLSIEVALLGDVGLRPDSPDRQVWRRAQELGMLLVTNNRNSEGPDSLEQTIREELIATSLPILTTRDAGRIIGSRPYREACANRIAEIVADLPQYCGIPRLFIP